MLIRETPFWVKLLIQLRLFEKGIVYYKGRKFIIDSKALCSPASDCISNRQRPGFFKMEEGNNRAKKRVRTDTFWNYSDKENAQYFDQIHKGQSDTYELRMDAVVKLDGNGKEQSCWRLYSAKTKKPADTIRSTKPYRLAMIWSVHYGYWSSEEDRKRVLSQLPKIETKVGDHSRHRCGNDWCCNPSHIVIGSRVDNEVDKHFHYFLNHPDETVRLRFREAFPDLMGNQGVW